MTGAACAKCGGTRWLPCAHHYSEPDTPLLGCKCHPCPSCPKPPERRRDGGAGSPRLFAVQQEQLTSDDYYTPAWVFERMGIEFDFDVASPPGGLDWIPAKHFFTQADDGLAQPWEGRVWMNPPYSDSTPWVRKFIEHGNGICLVPHAKSGWHVDLWNRCDGAALVRPFEFIGGWPFLPVWFAAFGDECVEAISRLGVVRRIA